MVSLECKNCMYAHKSHRCKQANLLGRSKRLLSDEVKGSLTDAFEELMEELLAAALVLLRE